MQDIQLPCELRVEDIDDGFAKRIRAQFEDEHRRRYGFDLDAPIEIATLRVVGASTTSEEVVEPAAGKGGAEAAPERDEQVFFDGEWHGTGDLRPRRARLR